MTAAVVAILLAVAATLAAGLRDRDGAPTEPVALQGNSVVFIDPKADAVVGEIDLHGRPGGIAVGLGSVWAGNRDDKTLLRIDPRTRRVVKTIGLGTEPTGMTVGGGSVWVVSQADVVLQIDPAINDVVARIELNWTGDICCPHQIAFARGAVWVSYWRLLVRIDPETRTAVLTPHRNVLAIASTSRALWGVVGVEGDRIQRLDPFGEPIRLDRLGAAQGLGGVTADDRAVWTASHDGTVARIEPDTGRVTASQPLNRPIAGVASGPRSVWIVTRAGDVLRADPVTGQVVKTISLGVFPPYLWGTIATGEGGVWVAALAP